MKKPGTSANNRFKISLNAYSFNDMLTGNRQQDNKPTLTLPELLDWCATQNIDAVEDSRGIRQLSGRDAAHGQAYEELDDSGHDGLSMEA